MNRTPDTPHPFVVAGPCSAESTAQLKAATEALCRLPQVGLIRAGVWKPRTRPGTFEGMGEEALQWMHELRQSSLHMADGAPLRFCCEVATPEHVELCQKYGIEDVWVGARTSVNPFLMADISEAMKGTSMNVLVKNPTTPDLALWIGALERVEQATAGSVVAVHRGFSMYDNLGYRNAPLWELPLKLRHEYPSITMLCDPSHISGNRQLVATLCRNAMQLAFDGLMIEVHPTPDQALTDAAQQITPSALEAILSDLECLSLQHSHGIPPQIDMMRSQIDDIDHRLLELLNRRMDLSRQIAIVKREQHLAVVQPDRWQSLLADRLRVATELGLDPTFVGDILDRIHAESVRVQIG